MPISSHALKVFAPSSEANQSAHARALRVHCAAFLQELEQLSHSGTQLAAIGADHVERGTFAFPIGAQPDEATRAHVVGDVESRLAGDALAQQRQAVNRVAVVAERAALNVDAAFFDV